MNIAYYHAFLQNQVPGADVGDRGYWREVGTLDSYFDAHMDLCATVPKFNLYNDRWPILTHAPAKPPAKFVHDDGDRVGRAVNSAVSNGVIVSGGLVRDSVLSPGTRIDSWSRVERAVILHIAASAAMPPSRTPSWTRTSPSWRAPWSESTSSVTESVA